MGAWEACVALECGCGEPSPLLPPSLPHTSALQPPPSKQVKDLTLTDRMHEMLAATMAPADEATAKV